MHSIFPQKLPQKNPRNSHGLALSRSPKQEFSAAPLQALEEAATSLGDLHREGFSKIIQHLCLLLTSVWFILD